MKNLWRIGLTLILLAFSGCDQQANEQDRGSLTTDPVYTNLLRSVSENTLFSAGDPSISLQFDSSYQYIGGQKFVLYGVADTEQYFFVETTADNKLQSLYWVQFEAYLPDNSYQYD